LLPLYRQTRDRFLFGFAHRWSTHPSFHRFRVIAVPPPTSRCVVAALSFSLATAAIRTVPLTLLNMREGDNCSKFVFQPKY
jgi:hypothetical protein